MFMLEDSPYADRATTFLVEIANAGQAESLVGLSLVLFVSLSVASMVIISGRKYGYTKLFRTFFFSALIFSPIMIFSAITVNLINAERSQSLTEDLNNSLEGKTTVSTAQAAQVYELGYVTIHDEEDNNAVLIRENISSEGITFSYVDKLTDEEYTTFLQSKVSRNPANARFTQ